MDYAAERARLLLGCYRTGDANDPETYVTAIAAVLAKYPDSVINAVTDPRIGLPRKKTWLPSIKEVYDACEAEYEPIREEAARQNRLKMQLRERVELEQAPRPTLAEMKDKYGQNWGIGEVVDAAKRASFEAPSPEKLVGYYQSRPGYLQWLADRKRVMRGEIEDYPKPMGAS
jgi:hypothetical protein